MTLPDPDPRRAGRLSPVSAPVSMLHRLATDNKNNIVKLYRKEDVDAQGSCRSDAERLRRHQRVQYELAKLIATGANDCGDSRPAPPAAPKRHRDAAAAGGPGVRTAVPSCGQGEGQVVTSQDYLSPSPPPPPRPSSSDSAVLERPVYSARLYTTLLDVAPRKAGLAALLLEWVCCDFVGRFNAYNEKDRGRLHAHLKRANDDDMRETARHLREALLRIF